MDFEFYHILPFLLVLGDHVFAILEYYLAAVKMLNQRLVAFIVLVFVNLENFK